MLLFWCRYKSAPLRLQVHLCFHGNGGYSLPAWVLEIGTHNPDIFFSDRQHDHSLDCLSIGIDEGAVYVALMVITAALRHMRDAVPGKFTAIEWILAGDSYVQGKITAFDSNYLLKGQNV